MSGLDFDEKTGVRTRSLRHAVVQSLIFHFGIVLRQENLVAFAQDCHVYLKLALCSIGPHFSIHEPEFGFCRPLHLILGNNEPAGTRENVICTEPSQLQKRCVASQALSADKYDSWCVGVAMACSQNFAPFSELQHLAPLNCLRSLRNQLFLTSLPRFKVDPLLRLDPADRVSLQHFPGAPVLVHEVSSALSNGRLCRSHAHSRCLAVPDLVSQALLALETRAQISLTAQDALALLRIKLDMRTHVTASDRAAALCVCSLHDQASLLHTERLLLRDLFDIVIPQLAVQFFEDESPR